MIIQKKYDLMKKINEEAKLIQFTRVIVNLK